MSENSHPEMTMSPDIDLLYEAATPYTNKHTVCMTKGESQDKYTKYPVPS